MSDDENSAAAILGAFVIGFANVWLSIYTVRQLWNWFVVPLGLQPMTLPLAFGFILLLGVLSYRWKPDQKKPTGRQAIEGVLSRTLTLLVSLGVGWCVVTWTMK